MIHSEHVQGHLKIAEFLVEKIAKREYVIGDRLPSQRQLMRLFRTNRNTVQRAFARLEHLGWVTAVHGKGYYVNEKPSMTSYVLSKFNSYTGSMIRVGGKPNAHLMNWELDAPTSEEQEHLLLSEGEKVYRLEILRFDRGHPQSISTSALSEKFVPGLDKFLGSFRSLHGLLAEQYQIRPIRKLTIIKTRMPDSEDASLLEMPEGIPIFYRININTRIDGSPIEYHAARSRGDMTEYVIDFETMEAGNVAYPSNR